MGNSRIGYDNLLIDATVAVSSEAEGYEKENAYDGLSYDFWKPSGVPAQLQGTFLGKVSGIKGQWLSDTTVETAVGTELATDGTFDTACSVTWACGTGWSIAAGVATHSAGSASEISQNLATIDGISYIVEFTVSGVTAGNVQPLFTGGGVNIGGALRSTNDTFIETITSNGNLSFVLSCTSDFDGDIDNVSVRLADPDRTANDNGLGVYGSIDKTLVASRATIVGYSNFSASNYLEQPYNSDFDPGTDAFTWLGHFNESANSAIEVLFERDSAATAQRVTIQMNADGTISFTCDDDTTVRTATTTNTYDDGNDHIIECEYSAGTLSIYIDAVLTATTTGAALLTLTNTSAVLRFGLDVQDSNPLTNGSLSLWRYADYTRTSEERRELYNKEKWYFKAGGPAPDAWLDWLPGADYLAVAAHDLADNDATIVLQYSDNGSSWTDAHDPVTLLNNDTIYRTFDFEAHDWWRINMSGGVSRIGAVSFGKQVTLPGVRSGFNPIVLSKESEVLNQTSEGGQLIGKSVIRTGKKGSISLTNMEANFVRQHWPLLSAAIETGSFFFLAEDDNFPDEAVFCWSARGVNTPGYQDETYMNVTIRVDAL
jgi:hypothetical protein